MKKGFYVRGNYAGKCRKGTTLFKYILFYTVIGFWLRCYAGYGTEFMMNRTNNQIVSFAFVGF